MQLSFLEKCFILNSTKFCKAIILQLKKLFKKGNTLAFLVGM